MCRWRTPTYDPLLNLQVIGTVTNSCDHPIDVQIFAEAFDLDGNILAFEWEFTSEIYDEFLVPHPIPILHVVPGQPVTVSFRLFSWSSHTDEIEFVDIAITEVDIKR